MKKKKRNLYFLLILIVMFSFSVGYSYLNTSLFVNVTSIVNANVWDVSLDNLNVTTGSVAAIKEASIDTNDSTSFEFEVKLEDEDDFYEFTIDVVNKGNVDAKLGSLVEVSSLTAEQENYFDHTIMYENKEPIEVNQIIKKEEFVRLKSRVEFKDDVAASSVPESAKTINVDVSLNYELEDNDGIPVKNNGLKIYAVANGNVEEIGTVVTLGTESFYSLGTDGDNVKLLAKYNLYLGNECTNSSNCTPYGEEATGMQNEDMKGFGYDESPYKGTTEFSSSGTDYNTSIVKTYVDNYKDLLVSLYDIQIVESRLLSHDELMSEEIGCVEGELFCLASPYEWIYSSSYWVYPNYNAYYVWRVFKTGGLGYSGYPDKHNCGVRPVIVLPRSEFKELSKFTIEGETYYAESDTTWEKWIGSKYDTYNNLVVGECLNVSDLCKDIYVWVGEVGTSADLLTKRLFMGPSPQRASDKIINGKTYVKGY